ncbi:MULTISPECIES: hypothetical protein [Clostridium]|uniref:Uncharacterized protein n=1 Tax=Clostridium saccharoperbutylacetonicum N1-4(HMT) TaxID=931276 RepID=M1MGK2_9CLOT|nr:MULTISPECIES: hypothetical protein [Clostridium]AGF57054.1 hypothetical protein Cspa_c32930 [Clostridium saccharoperbutylacetonicum N1-4(HMT)]AQR95744.1 hypothetical protein CLSAP_30600 [Clostridium saccharoperbutylacetonicum]NRT62187.1 hypothetical protein [Clostridium saccharoperbutylacetonicum]NSB25518.1 hypothetical protein [Clostridium saccharoperbutylacetonicum]NSB31607.1 hypothetical protein [Clostridium saccharoperbutylacetonicum]
MSKDKKEKLILQSGSMSQSKVKSYVEKERDELRTKRVSRGKDITINNKY